MSILIDPVEFEGEFEPVGGLQDFGEIQLEFVDVFGLL